jgi:glycosyltransferase involved in cell wall biosynthesis
MASKLNFKDRGGAPITTALEPQMVPLRLAGKRAIAVVYSCYPGDPRPCRSAEALLREGFSVEVICLKETDEEPERDRHNGVDITRVGLKHKRGGKLSYIARYGAFILISGAILASRAFRRPYDVVHVHNMPDVLVFSALIPKLLGAKVIIDLHDPMPELMETIFGLRQESRAVWLLKMLEKWSLRYADAVITVNEACKRIFSARSCSADKITVIMNSPDERIFRHHEASEQNPGVRDNSKPFVIMYHGSLVERHGVDLAVSALQTVRNKIPNAELRMYGRSTPFLEQVMNQVRESELGEAVRYLGAKSLEQISQAIGECDVGMIPNRRSIFTEINTPTRIFEYLSQGKPVIAPRTPGILDYFEPSELVLFEVGDTGDLAVKIEYVFRHPQEMTGIVKRGQEVFQAHRWTSERIRFVNLVDRLLNGAKRPLVQTDANAQSALGSQK